MQRPRAGSILDLTSPSGGRKTAPPLLVLPLYSLYPYSLYPPLSQSLSLFQKHRRVPLRVAGPARSEEGGDGGAGRGVCSRGRGCRGAACRAPRSRVEGRSVVARLVEADGGGDAHVKHRCSDDLRCPSLNTDERLQNKTPNLGFALLLPRRCRSLLFRRLIITYIQILPLSDQSLNVDLRCKRNVKHAASTQHTKAEQTRRNGTPTPPAARHSRDRPSGPA